MDFAHFLFKKDTGQQCETTDVKEAVCTCVPLSPWRSSSVFSVERLTALLFFFFLKSVFALVGEEYRVLSNIFVFGAML